MGSIRNIKKISNYSIAGLLAVGVMILSLFAYREKIQADTVVPGYATAHLNIHVTVPTITSVPFKATFLPQTASKNYYFKERTFELSAAGLNTIEWYIRKIPAGNYKVILESNGQQLTNSPFIVTLLNDKVNDTTSFELNLGSPPSSEIAPQENNTEKPNVNLPDPGYDQEQSPPDQLSADSPLPEETGTVSDLPPTPGEEFPLEN
jgi:hypothetical protein